MWAHLHLIHTPVNAPFVGVGFFFFTQVYHGVNTVMEYLWDVVTVAIAYN